MSWPQIVRAASARSISWPQAAGYHAFKGKGLPLAIRSSRSVPWPALAGRSAKSAPDAASPQAGRIALGENPISNGGDGRKGHSPADSKRQVAQTAATPWRPANGPTAPETVL